MNREWEQPSSDTDIASAREPLGGDQPAGTGDPTRAGATPAAQGPDDGAESGRPVDTGTMSEVDPRGRTGGDGPGAGMLSDDEVSSYRQQWNDIQVRFVDEPQTAVANADGLVVEVTGRLVQRFSQQREKLEEEWSRGGESETEGLRVALQHYRSFFESLLER
jgi:hypothetical protein